MINVTIADNGDIVMRCTRCGKYTRVLMKWSQTPFWEVFTGQAVLVLLGHLEKDHAIRSAESRT